MTQHQATQENHAGKEHGALVGFLTGRYGSLALARAAGEAAAASRRGDHEQNALWSRVIATLRQSIPQTLGDAI